MKTSIITLEKIRINEDTTFQITKHNGQIVFEKFFALRYSQGYNTYKTEKSFRAAVKRELNKQK